MIFEAFSRHSQYAIEDSPMERESIFLSTALYPEHTLYLPFRCVHLSGFFYELFTFSMRCPQGFFWTLVAQKFYKILSFIWRSTFEVSMQFQIQKCLQVVLLTFLINDGLLLNFWMAFIGFLWKILKLFTFKNLI
jgi:hypothetical protein